MLRSMLVGLDGSAYATAAVELGIQWGQRYDALLVGLGVIDEPDIRGAEPVPLGASDYKVLRDDALVADARRKVEQVLGQFTVRCAEAGVSCKVLEDVGLPYDRLALQAQRYDLILLGRETHFEFETQATADDTLTRVLKHCPRPVVVVPEAPHTAGPVVVAYDGSLQAARTLQLFQALALARGHDVHVVAVAGDAGEAARRADRAVEFLRFHEVAAHAHVVEADAAAPALLDQVRRLGAGLVVMGAYGQPTLREFFFGSVTRTMLRESHTPLFLYH